MKYLIANWKMNMDLERMTSWFEVFIGLLKTKSGAFDNKVEIIVAPSFVFLEHAVKLAKNTPIHISAQDMFHEYTGAFTGKISAQQLKDVVETSIIGHSETQTPKAVLQKEYDLCLENHIRPVVCFIYPETLPENLKSGGLVAWEDPRNISKNGVYDPKDPQEVANNVAHLKAHQLKDQIVLYGGSINRESVKDLTAISGIEGFLVGNASLDPTHFFEIISSCV